MSTQSVAFVLVHLVVNIAIGICENPIVTINDGQVMGVSNQTIEGNVTYYAFRAIPFAKPPTGSLRFKAPQRPDSWNGVLNGTLDGSECMQYSDGAVIGSEDCLFVNVYTTDLNLNGNLPVLVWIYGGGFVTGSSSYENNRPDYFLDEGGIIYVSFNYRLNALGWLSTDDEYCPGNAGLKDQILALQWIQENIAYFGGDPNNVTIFGESAGAASVAYLLQSNSTEGLFKGAIMQSGTSLNAWALQVTPKTHAMKLGTTLGILGSSDSQNLMEALMEKDAEEIVEAANTVNNLNFVTDVLAGLIWAPVVEPFTNESVFSLSSHDALSAGSFRQVPLIVGYNSNELGAVNELASIISLLLILYDLDVTKLAPYSLSDSTTVKLRAGREIKNEYFGIFGTLSSQPEEFIEWANFDQFNRPIREFVNLTSRYTDVYNYRFAYVGELGGPVANRSYWGVGHAEELNYIFVSDNDPAEDDNVVRKRMVKLWCNFAKTGSPEYTSSNNTLFSTVSSSEWSVARTSGSSGGNLMTTSALSYLDITSNLVLRSDPNQTDFVYYRNDIYGEYGDDSYTTY